MINAQAKKQKLELDLIAKSALHKHLPEKKPVSHLISNDFETSSTEKSSMMTEKNGDTECKNGYTKDLTLILESDTQALGHQIAGHDRIGILKHKLGYVLKPVQKEPLGSREVEFYKTIFADKVPNGESSLIETQRFRLQNIIPKFHGMTKILTKDSNDKPFHKEYLILEDIIQGFVHPCVMDIKIGAQTWDPEAIPFKIAHEKSKYVGTKGPLGLSLSGMEWFDLNLGKTVRLEKGRGKSLDKSSFIETIREFLNQSFNKEISKIVAKKLLKCLEDIRVYFEEQRNYNFYSSSLLISYDANCDFFNNVGPAETSNGDRMGAVCNFDTTVTSRWVAGDFVRVWMIDFAHVFPAVDNQPDGNYIFGLDNLIKILKDMY